MALISIRRYLDQYKPGGGSQPGSSLHAAACGVLMTEVDARLLAGRCYAGLRPEWGGLAQMLESLEAPDDLAGIQVKASAVLAERQRLETEREQTQGQDVRHILGVLNEALLSLASGNEGSVDRLRRLETALHRTSQLNDLVEMKVSLTETIRQVREETEQTRAEGAGAIQKLDAELQKARAASQNLPGLPGRAEAITRLKAAAAPGAAMSLAVACQMERLRIIRSRYGAAIADDVLMAFVRCGTGEKGDEAYRWAEDAVVFVHCTEQPVLEKRQQLEDSFAQPFEHSVMTGGRAALFSVAIRWLCTSPVEAGLTDITDEFDQFFEGRRWRP